MLKLGTRGWSAVAAIAATYFYFLLFAEFAFLELAARPVPGAAGLRTIMAVLGVAGVSGGVFAARRFSAANADALLRWSMRACAAGAAVALLGVTARSPIAMVAAAGVTGGALGALTVTLASVLRGALGDARLGWGIGLGTGLAYALCNLPWVFHASPAIQATLAGAVLGGASFLPRLVGVDARGGAAAAPHTSAGAARWIVILLALVWLDSAAFYIIQHTATLREDTWSENLTLLGNAGSHLVIALIAGWLLDRGRRGPVLTLAALALAGAGLLLNGTWTAPVSPNWIYTAGVSLYSVVLVEFPARVNRPGLAALVFGVAGWGGSALGIGMAQNLARIPTTFVVVTVALVLTAIVWRRRRKTGVLVAALGAATVARGEDAVGLGREVYIAEGCIHCHSQYIRPRVAAEVLNWGPATPLPVTLAAAPPLIGTRRQGPDLSQVGNRRSAEWNRLHLMAPQAVSPGSRMPGYAHLFKAGDPRGEALVAYLGSLGAATLGQRLEQTGRWTPTSGNAIAPQEAAQLFNRLCVQCHGAAGRGDGALAKRLNARPPDWSREPWRHVAPGADVEAVISRIIKFGLPGLPMAGHEYLPDAEIVGLARHVRMLHEKSPAGAVAGSLP